MMVVVVTVVGWLCEGLGAMHIWSRTRGEVDLVY